LLRHAANSAAFAAATNSATAANSAAANCTTAANHNRTAATVSVASAANSAAANSTAANSTATNSATAANSAAANCTAAAVVTWRNAGLHGDGPLACKAAQHRDASDDRRRASFQEAHQMCFSCRICASSFRL